LRIGLGLSPAIGIFLRTCLQTSYRGFAPRPQMGSSIPRLPDEPSSQILDPPLVLKKMWEVNAVASFFGPYAAEGYKIGPAYAKCNT